MVLILFSYFIILFWKNAENVLLGVQIHSICVLLSVNYCEISNYSIKYLICTSENSHLSSKRKTFCIPYASQMGPPPPLNKPTLNLVNIHQTSVEGRRSQTSTQPAIDPFKRGVSVFLQKQKQHESVRNHLH